MRASTALAVSETITAFAIGLFFVWIGWRFWSFVRRSARLDRGRPSLPAALFVAGFAAFALCFFGLGGLSLVYPFDLRGRMHPPAGSPGEVLELAAFACLPAGALLMALGTALIAYWSRRTHA